MRTREISYKTDGIGGGARTGTTTLKTFECPCGKGTIEEEHDDIPGFKNHTVDIHCVFCKERYLLDTSKGVSSWELIPRP